MTLNVKLIDSIIFIYKQLFRRNLDFSNDVKQTAVGISFSLDKLSSLFQTESSGIDVILCSSSNNSTMTEEKLNIAKDLWTMGIKTLVLNVEQVTLLLFSNV